MPVTSNFGTWQFDGLKRLHRKVAVPDKGSYKAKEVVVYFRRHFSMSYAFSVSIIAMILVCVCLDNIQPRVRKDEVTELGTRS
jgi:hypothetical protein